MKLGSLKPALFLANEKILPSTRRVHLINLTSLNRAQILTLINLKAQMSHLLISVYPRSAVNRAWKLDMTSNRGNRELYYGLGTKILSLSLLRSQTSTKVWVRSLKNLPSSATEMANTHIFLLLWIKQELFLSSVSLFFYFFIECCFLWDLFWRFCWHESVFYYRIQHGAN